ncbi:MAG: hypothetical protein PHY77_06465, partial [Desulfotomaculaceae bacterium]|nr:hypothetical protein [Desulfotomaculaceae bacterium]
RPGAVYHMILDTSRPYGQDLLTNEDAAPLPGRFYIVAPQSVVILSSKFFNKKTNAQGGRTICLPLPVVKF